MEIKVNKFIIDNKEYNITINSKDITGIYTNNIERIKKLLNFKYPLTGDIYIDNKRLTDDNVNYYQCRVSIVETYKPIAFIKTVLDYMNYIIVSKNLQIKKPNKKIIDSLKIVGLDDRYLLQEFNTLSNSEKELIQIAMSLLSNPEIIILTNQFIKLDLNNQKKIYMLLTRLKEQYNKVIIFLTNDANILYKYCSKCIIIKNDKVLIEENTKNIYSKIELLKRHKVSIPEIVDFTYKARKLKKVKLEYHQDIRDIIKDIYKHI